MTGDNDNGQPGLFIVVQSGCLVQVLSNIPIDVEVIDLDGDDTDDNKRRLIDLEIRLKEVWP